MAAISGYQTRDHMRLKRSLQLENENSPFSLRLLFLFDYQPVEV